MSSDDLAERMRRKHLEDHPNCTYGDQPHFVPPSFGQVGFYACDPPDDLTNYSRITLHSPYMAPEVKAELRAANWRCPDCGRGQKIVPTVEEIEETGWCPHPDHLVWVAGGSQ